MWVSRIALSTSGQRQDTFVLVGKEHIMSRMALFVVSARTRAAFSDRALERVTENPHLPVFSPDTQQLKAFPGAADRILAEPLYVNPGFRLLVYGEWMNSL